MQLAHPLPSFVACFAFSTLVAVGVAQELPEDWLPREVLEGFAGKLAEQILAVPGVEESEDEVLEKARTTVEGIASSIGSLGIEGLVELAPRHAGLDLPGGAPAALAAIGRYGLCSAFLQEVYHDVHGSGYTVEDRISAAVGMTVLPLVTGPLREALLAAGTTDEQMRAYLASEESNALFDRVWNDRELLEKTRDACNPALTRIVDGS